MKGSIKELIEKLVKGVLFGSIEKTAEKERHYCLF